MIEIVLAILVILITGWILTAPPHAPYSHERPAPTTERPDLPVIQNRKQPKKPHPKPAYDDGSAYAHKWPKPSHNDGKAYRKEKK